MNSVKKILVLAPHTDDAELGCGGTIARFLDEGLKVDIAVYSTAKESLPQGSPPDTLKNEFFEAVQILGLDRASTHIFDYPVRRLVNYRQAILENLVELREILCPEIVLVPSGADLHQDHQVLYAEAIRAFKHLTLWGYELPWNHITFSAQAFVMLKSHHIERKWSALQAYKSQIELKRRYFTYEFVEGLARVRGTQVNTQFAEAFEVVRIRW